MPPVSPCGLVVDYVRSCFTGLWRFYPERPDLLTPGRLYFSPADTPSLQTPHAFGSSFWDKDGMTPPMNPVGLDITLPWDWDDGQPPDDIPPPNQIGRDADFATDLEYDPDVTVTLRAGFDAQCWIVPPQPLVPDPDPTLRPNLVDCCWQRVCARLLDILQGPGPTIVAEWTDTARLLWPAPIYDMLVEDPVIVANRFAWVKGPTYQVVFLVGTQEWGELFAQVFHGFQPPRLHGPWGTADVWFDAATDLSNRLNAAGWDPDLPITFIGHSKGGAVVYVLARRLLDANPNRNIQVLTFGIPKPGNLDLVRNTPTAAERHVVTAGDIIPYLPPSAPFLRLMVFLGADQITGLSAWEGFSTYDFIPVGQTPRVQALPDLPFPVLLSIVQNAVRGRASPPAAEHRLSNYVAALAACCCNPRLPFTPLLWTELFGAAGDCEGGVMDGGGGDWQPVFSSGGVAVGGSTSPDVIGLTNGTDVYGLTSGDEYGYN